MMNEPTLAILHYSAPPIVGGVENVLLAHARLLVEGKFPLTILAGVGEKDALPSGSEFVCIPEMDTRDPGVVQISRELEQGRLPDDFETMVAHLVQTLAPLLQPMEHVIIHNIFTKHFNLPLTAALLRLLEQGVIRHCIAWCHDFTWSSSHSRSKVFPGYPWDLLRTYRPDVTYVTVSRARQGELAGLFKVPAQKIQVVYNGVDPQELLGISNVGMELSDRLGLWGSDLNLLMPVRVTQAKNIELGIRLVAVLKERNLHLRLIISGPPDPHDPENMEYFESLRALCRWLGVEAEVCFVVELGAQPGHSLLLDAIQVGELYRLCDVLFMPSHREGFGMPILEAGLQGIPVFCSDTIPAAVEIGGSDVIQFSPDINPNELADKVLDWLEHSQQQILRRRVRQGFTWQSIFQYQIVPLLGGGKS